MDFFLQLDEHLSNKLDDACNNFNDFVRIKLVTHEYSSITHLNGAEVKKLFHVVRDQIKSQHKLDYKIIRESPYIFLTNPDQWQDFRNLVNNIEKRNMREIENLRAFKMMLVYEKLESENLRDVDKQTLIEWISED